MELLCTQPVSPPFYFPQLTQKTPRTQLLQHGRIQCPIPLHDGHFRLLRIRAERTASPPVRRREGGFAAQKRLLSPRVVNGTNGGGCEAEAEAEGARCGEEEGHFWGGEGWFERLGGWGGGVVEERRCDERRLVEKKRV